MHGLAIGPCGVLTHALGRTKSSGISKGKKETWSVSKDFWLIACLALSTQFWKDTMILLEGDIVTGIGVD